jgi:cyclomaltodextrin glucanotransferase
MKYVHRILFFLIFLLFSFSIFAASQLFADSGNEFYGTTEPFAEEAIYFVLTDRFVDGDGGNNFTGQGGDCHDARKKCTWVRRLDGPNGQTAFVGYMGGDFKGIYNNADYIKNMGFTAIWISPIVDNPDEAFTGGSPVSFGSGVGTDGGKTGYHGYWGVNFYKVDEHLESPGFTFGEFTEKMKQDHDIKIILDIVGNHGSPSFTMPEDQPKFGEIYDEEVKLVADHQNLDPGQLDPEHNLLHTFFNKGGGLAQLSDLNESNDDVLDYLVEAYLKWIDDGADAFRIDTIAWMPHSFWKKFSDHIRKEHPDFFMFGENFNFNAGAIAQHQRPENGGISVLDFPGKSSITHVFQNPGSNYSDLLGYLHLTDDTYTNPYELVTFYDNHDMARMSASQDGFIDAHNWLFTSRGIPCVYYGSEMRFEAGRAEHMGNRNYYGSGNIASARTGVIYERLAKMATIRKASPALQKGLQVNIDFNGQKASFYRVYQKDGKNQTALVLLNKGSSTESFTIDKYVSAGTWTDAHTGETIEVTADNPVISTAVGAHDVKVLLLNEEVNHEDFIKYLRLMMILTGERVTVVPDTLVAGKNVTVTYREEPEQQIELHWGINNWNGIGTPMGDAPMTFVEEELAYEVTLQIPLNANQFDFVFHNLTKNTWDNNGGQDWHYLVLPGEVPPDAPSDISAVAGDQSVTLDWNDMPGATSYSIYYTDDGTSPTKDSSKESSADSSFTHSGLTNGLTYKYRITAANAFGESDLSDEAAATPVESFKTNFGHGAVLRLTGAEFSGWDPANSHYVLKLVSDNVWETTVSLSSTLSQTPYKLTLNGSWAVNWGGGASGSDTHLARTGANATITLNPGNYALRVTEGTNIDSPVRVQWVER